MAFALRAAGVERSYGRGEARTAVLRGVDLEVREGERLAITGRSGSGKSTLMHLLALLDRPDSGEVEVLGRRVARLPEREINSIRNGEIGFVFQQFFLTPNASVLENVLLPAVIGRRPRSARRGRALEVLDRLGLADRASSRAVDLSGGQKQRVVIARALMNEPRIVFADEPTGNLDATTGAMVEDLLFGLSSSDGITLVVVTHDEELAGRCDRRVQMTDGRLVPEAVAA